MNISLTDLWLTFTTGLLASGHCIGMCGGIVTAYSISANSQQRSMAQRVVAHFLYAFGRLGTYIALGAMAGWLGSYILFMKRFPLIKGFFPILAGIVMILMGLEVFGSLGFMRGTGVSLMRFFGKRMANKQSWQSPLFLGHVTGLLPCGLHWAFQAKAMATGSVTSGMAILLAFGLGTLPAMLGLGFVTSWLSHSARTHLLRAASLMVIIMGLLAIKRGLTIWGTLG